jgi:NTE family protein
VLKVLEREGIPIDCLAGTSMGGLIAAAYAAGLSAVEIEAEARRILRPRNLLRLIDIAPARYGLLSGNSVHHYLEQVLGPKRTFGDLRLPLGLTAVDLVTGRLIALTEGPFIDAVHATIAFPAIFDPVRMGDSRLVDGGVLNHLPVDVARQLGAEMVIAVDVGLDFYALDLMDNPRTSVATRIAHNAWRSESLTIEALVACQLQETQPEVLLHPRIPAEVTAFNGFSRVAEIIVAGEQTTNEALPQIRRAGRPALRFPRLRSGQSGSGDP